MARVAILLDEGFEDSELRVPWDRLLRAGHAVTIVGRSEGAVLTGKRGLERVTVDAGIGSIAPEGFDAVVIPGGRSPARLVEDPRMVAFARAFFRTGKPLAAVCHGPQLLAAAGVVHGRTLTSWPAISDELVGAGARWLDREVVEDGQLVTSRRPADLEAFSAALLRRLDALASSAEGPFAPASPS